MVWLHCRLPRMRGARRSQVAAVRLLSKDRQARPALSRAAGSVCADACAGAGGVQDRCAGQDGALTDDTGAILDDLLCRWHHWQRHYRSVQSWRRSALVVGEFRSGREFDADNGVLDEHLEHQTMRAIDFEVSELCDPWRAAIYAEAQNLAVGASVFVSPRLPGDPEQRRAVVSEARRRLCTRLMSAGVL